MKKHHRKGIQATVENTNRGRPLSRVMVLQLGQTSVMLQRRSLWISLVLMAVAGLVGVLTVATGTYNFESDGVVGVILGGGTGQDRFIILEQRLPRVLAAFAVGALLGMAGAVFQSISRNPLGSPDIIGFTTGASTGGLVIILLTGAPSAFSTALGTVVGGMLTAAVVVLLTLTRGVGGDRLIIGGIAIGAMLSSVNDYLISRADLETAEAAKVWQFGSLNMVTWSVVLPLAAFAGLLFAVAPAAARPMQILEMGDDAAASLGVRVRRERILLLGYGVVLAAVAVAAAGPIGFLALAAPQLARRLTRSPGVTLMASGAMGALILVIADLAAQRLLAPFQIPVGLVSAAVGGVYLMWILSFARREVR